MRTIKALPIILTLTGSLLATPILSPQPSVAAEGVTRLPFSIFTDMVVDEAHGHVFITGGSETDVVVTDLGGVKTGRIDNVDGSRMELSHDGETLYVARPSHESIGLIDTSTLEMTNVPLGFGIEPLDLAETAGRLWFSHSAANGSVKAVGYLDLADNSVHPGIRTGFDSVPQLESSPALPGELVVGDVVKAPGHLEIVTVTEDEEGTVTLPTRTSTELRAFDYAISADGSRIVATDYQNGRHLALTTTDLSVVGTYATGDFPNAVAIRSDGLVAAGNRSLYEPDLSLFRPGSQAVFRDYTFATTDQTYLLTGGLTFAGDRLFAVVGDQYNGNPVLRVLSSAGASALSIRTSKKTYNYDATAKVTVKLATNSSNKAVAVYAKPYGRAETLVREAKVDSSGTLTVSTPVKRRTTFRVAYAGDGLYDSAEASTTVKVRAKVTTELRNHFAFRNRVHFYRANKLATVIGTVIPNRAGECVGFRAQYYRGPGWSSLLEVNCVELTSRSKARILLDGHRAAGVIIRVRAEWGGDTLNAASNSPWRYLKFVR